jgi:C-terminal processing protease CtpA/Prc
LSYLGSPADKAGLCIDDEIISMNDEYIEHMTFDQVRKILKERNLRGSIKLVVRTYEGKYSLSILSIDDLSIRLIRFT